MAGVKGEWLLKLKLSVYVSIPPVVLAVMSLSLISILHFIFFLSVCHMDLVKAIVTLSFTGAIGILLVVLGCALEQYGIWWPMFVLFFYCLAPVPTVVARRFSEDFSSNAANLAKEISFFLTSGIVISAFGLPIVLAHSGIIKWGAMALVSSGNVFIFFTILAYFIVFAGEDEWGF